MTTETEMDSNGIVAFTYVYAWRCAVGASVFAALGMQRRNIDVVEAIGGWIQVNVSCDLVGGDDHRADRQSRIVVDQPDLVLRHVVARWKRLHADCQIRRSRHVDVYERREHFDIDTVLWKDSIPIN